MALAYLQYDVFTTDPLAGNQLAVFLDGRGVSPARMQALAREMNFSESTFILPSEAAGTDVRMRIFTPGSELPMAGHPTIGSTFALAESGVIKPGAARFVFGLGVGPTPVDLEWEGSRLRFAWMTQRNPTFDEPIADRAGAAAANGLTVDDLVPSLPVQQISCGLPYVLLPLKDKAAVDRAAVNAEAYKRFAASTGLKPDACFYLFSVSPAGPLETAARNPPYTLGETAYARMFAPAFGIAEDPATGSAAGPLACYLVHHQLVTGAAARSIVIRQGVAMGRPSTIHAAIGTSGGTINEVKVGGQAVLVARGELVV